MRRLRRQLGFTLIEAIIVMVIIGVIAGMVGMFIRLPIQQYTDVAARAEMTDIADTALRRIGRDLRLSLPNSVRTTDTSLEFLQTRTGGRYRSELESGGAGAPLRPEEAAATTFDVIGAMPVLPVAGNYVVVYNLGIPGADAYEGSNRATVASANATSMTLTASKLFPLASPGNRFHVVDTPVTYRCADGKLTRYWGYAITAAQAAVPSGGSSAVMAENVSSCTFNYEQNIINQRWGVVTMTLSLSKNNETVNLIHEVHVSNVP